MQMQVIYPQKIKKICFHVSNKHIALWKKVSSVSRFVLMEQISFVEIFPQVGVEVCPQLVSR